MLLAYQDSKDLPATIEYLSTITELFPDNEKYKRDLQALIETEQQLNTQE